MGDYALFILLRAIVFCMKFLPLNVWLVAARALGWLYYYVAGKKNRRAYQNLKVAFPGEHEKELKAVLRKMYQRLAQNLIEALYLSYIDEKYVKEHVRVPDTAVVEEALKAGRGVVFLACHAGSWELSNAACAMLFKSNKYAMLARPQDRHQRLDGYLNTLRASKGCSVIRVDELKKMVEHLSAGGMLGAVADHGGKDGVPVEFFGKLAMTPVGGVRLAKKLGSKIVLAFMRRVNGPDHEMIFKSYELVKTADVSEDIRVNLTNINKVFEDWIARYPEEYLWFYKRWKYSPQKNVLVVSDRKLGHVKQSLALVEMIRGLGFSVRCDVVNLEYRREGFNDLLTLIGFFLGSGAAFASLPFFLKKNTILALTKDSYDLIVSAGSSTAVVNLALARQNSARSVALMRPGIFSFNRFDLVIMPEHDLPLKRKNVLVTVGSLNMVSGETIKSDFASLAEVYPALKEEALFKNPKIGVLIGGHSKNYKFTEDMAVFLGDQLKKALEELGAHLYLTTSRRTPAEAVAVLKKYFKHDARCKLFVVPAENNPIGTVGAIFDICDVIIVSGESISMVSEAVASGKYTIVFEPRVRQEDNKVRRFLNFLAGRNYIYLLKLNEIYGKLSWLFSTRPEQPILNNRAEIREGLKKIL